eukprot:g15708.t1
MLIPTVSRTGCVIATATAGCVIVALLASTTLSDGGLRYSRQSSLEVSRGVSPVILAVGEQQRESRRFSALPGTADTRNDCAANGISDEDAVEAFDNTTALSLGNWVARILTGRSRAGGEGGTWYEDTLATLLVEYCEEEQQGIHHRYVTSQNATAAKDEYGDCIEVLDGDQEAYAAGLCERVANCYWEEPREHLERKRRYTDAKYEANERAARTYIRSIVLTYGTLGFVLAAGVLAGCVKFAVRRCLYNKCLCDGDLQRDRTGYTDMEQKVPAAIFVVGLAIVIFAGLLGLQGNSNVTSGLESMFSTMEEATDGIQELASSVASPLTSFVSSLNASAVEVELLLSSTGEWLGELETGMLLRLDADRFLGRGAEFDALAEGVELASADFVEEAVDDVSALMSFLQQEFLGMTDVMEGQSLNVLATLAVANATARENRERFAHFRKWSDEYVDLRTTGIQGLVAAMGAAGVVGLLGVMAGLANNKTCSPCINLLRLTCVIAFTATWVAFILSSLVIVSAVTWSDGCQFLDLAATQGWETAGLDGLSAGVLDGCLRGKPVAEKFNLTEALTFFKEYPTTAEEVGAVNTTFAEATVETAVYAISDFVDSLNTTAVAVLELDYYTNAEVNGSLLLDPECPYNVTFDGEEATAYLGRPWLALPTVSTAATVATDGDSGGNGNSSSSDWTNQTTVSPPRTPWEAGGERQSFGREGNESASAYMSRIFNSSDCASVNGLLLSAWDSAARERAYRDQMHLDLTCTTATATTTPWCATGGSGDTMSTSSPAAASSSSFSSTFSLSPCSCTSDAYSATGAPDTLLQYFRTFADNVTALRADLAGLLGLPLAVGRGALASASSDSWAARCASRCSSVASHYHNFEGAMCSTALSGLAQIGFSMFLIGVGGLALAITSGIMVHRLKAVWAKNITKVLSTEEDIVMEEY